jgi:hypothetical protein
MLEKVPGDIASTRQLYLVTKPPSVGINADGLSCPYTVLPHVAVRLECNVPGPGLLSFTWSPDFS